MLARMDITMILIAGVGALVVGLFLGVIAYRLYRAGVRKAAELEADEILQEAKDEAELRLLEEKEKTQELETVMWAKEEPAMLKTEERIEELEELATEKKQKADDRYSQARQISTSHEQEVKKEEAKIKEKEAALEALRKNLRDLNDQYVEKLSGRLNSNKEDIKAEIISDLEKDTARRAQAAADAYVEETKEHSEVKAKQILDRALDRFQRAYSAERGISSVYFENPEQRKNLTAHDGAVIKAVEDACGCDIIVQPDMELVGVAGFDPVRRELTRRTLESILKERKPVTPDWVTKKAGNHKTEMMRSIKNDGDAIAKELRLEGLHPEIRQMMGSLRYRYSFTQNQYFHCGEVGFLCGLLAAELNSSGINKPQAQVNIKKARRSGLLHDLGKAMDHELDGGHAVIGADFIKARGEAEDVVHAVKAHHYDEAPSTDMAFLVIAADAISGARPGARRSTIETYNQKVTELDAIARSFHGVTDCYILNGGRECRVLVNGRQVDDMQALKLSSEIAKKIEEECNYPGQIKVVVVRNSLSVETTRKEASV